MTAEGSFHFAGYDFTFQSAQRSDQVAQAMQSGRYEVPLPLLLMAVVCRTTGTLLDVGANTGLYTMLAGKVRSDQRIIAFEPFAEIFDICELNIKNNGIRDRVTLKQLALSDRNGFADLYIPDDSHGLIETSCSLEQRFKPSFNSVQVELARFDDLGIRDTISVIKVDIEGHEAAFIRGAERTIEANRPIIFAEMLIGAQETFAGLSRYFGKLDYLPFRMRDDSLILTKAIRYDGRAWNYAIVPREKMGLIEECGRIHNLEILQSYGF